MLRDGADTLPFLHSPTRFLLHYIAARPWIFLALGLLVAAASVSSIGVQYAMKLLIDAMTGGVRARSTVYYALAGFLSLVILESLLQRAAALTLGQATVSSGVGIRLDMVNYLTGHQMPFFQNQRAGSLGHRISGLAGIFGAIVHRLLQEVTPPLIDMGDRVPVTPANKRGIVDPASALMMPAVSRGELTDQANCNRTIPIFDGATRFNVVLSYGETRNVEKPGYSGPVLVCNARYQAIAGHRPDRPGVKFMEDNRDMSVWLAPVEGTRVLLPVRIAVRTTLGTNIIEATRWNRSGAAGTTTAAAPIPAGHAVASLGDGR
jgi:hypothetical protein